jgi:RNA polymerase sigma factor (TIGR02999 family)
VDQLTQILHAAERGDREAAGRLIVLVYDELRNLAAQKLARESPGQTLDATALVNEAYLRLVGSSTPPHFAGRAHFFAAAAEAMRRILVDNARRKRSIKAGGDRKRVDLAEVEPAVEPPPNLDILALDEALVELEAKDKRKAELVKLRFFAGLSNEEAADALGISVSTADNDWAYARAWLRLEMEGTERERTRT